MTSKTLNPIDYQQFGYLTFLYDSLVADKMPHRPSHLHRRWEYGMALMFLQQHEGIKTVIDVGGGGSLFAPLASMLGYEVTVVDPATWTPMASVQGSLLETSIAHVQAEYEGEESDAIVCISVLEHVDEDAALVAKMCAGAKKAVYLTVDFSRDGAIYTLDQVRTYTAETLRGLASSATGFTAEEGDYVCTEPGYTFASLGLTRVAA